MKNIRKYRVWSEFSLKIILPALSTIALFIIAIFLILIPSLEKSMMDSKKEMLKELTSAAMSTLFELHRKEQSGIISPDEAKKAAIKQINSIRYGKEKKDYFWIMDMQTVMIDHPYRPDLNGRNLSNFQDKAGKKLFSIFIKKAKTDGGGYVDYIWQWKDDSSKIVKKLSYIEKFEPWNWIIGTGIYPEDVREEISLITARIIKISSIISVIILLLLLLIAFYSMKIEKEKAVAKNRLKNSKEKYKKLVEASTEGTIMMLDGNFFYTNSTILEMLGYSADEFKKLTISDIVSNEKNDKNSGAEFLNHLSEEIETHSHFEAFLKKKNAALFHVILSISSVKLSGKSGFIIIVKDIDEESKNEQKQIELARENLIAELQASQLFLAQPIKKLVRSTISINLNSSVRKAAELMTKNSYSSLMITADSGEFIGIVTDLDMRERVVSKDFRIDSPIYEIMTSPVITISENALIFEAIYLLQERDITHLAVKNSSGKVRGMIDSRQLMKIQRYSAAFLFKEINTATSLEEIYSVNTKLPVLVKALVDSGAKPKNITRIISKISDSINIKLIRLAIDELGEPPAKFSFLVFGSEGREEQTLVTDQDNAIVYEDVPPEKSEEVNSYFMKLSERVCGWLDSSGYSFCEGGIMAKNQKWCQPVSRWREYFTKWISDSEPEDLLEVNIFFDFKSIYGFTQFPSELRDHINSLLKEHPLFFIHMTRNCLLSKPPVGLFGKIMLESREGEHSKTFNIKDAIRPLTDLIRIYALKHSLDATNTLERIEKLYEKKLFRDTDYNEIIHTYNFLMQQRLKNQAISKSMGEKTSNEINPKQLTEIEISMLKKSFSEISTLQTKLSYDFLGSIG